MDVLIIICAVIVVIPLIMIEANSSKIVKQNEEIIQLLKQQNES